MAANPQLESITKHKSPEFCGLGKKKKKPLLTEIVFPEETVNK
jgi:hypothetical protein